MSGEKQIIIHCLDVQVLRRALDQLVCTGVSDFAVYGCKFSADIALEGKYINEAKRVVHAVETVLRNRNDAITLAVIEEV